MNQPPRIPKLEQLEARWLRAGLPYGAVANDTGEFMLGRIAVTPILLESNGQGDASTENWNAAHIASVTDKLSEAFSWWKDLLATKSSVHTLDFVIDRTYVDTPSPTVYEPINRRSDDYALWSQEFLMRAGYDDTSSLEQNMRTFNNAQRLKYDADWAFTIFVVNSEVESDGTFNGGSFARAFAFAGGLFFVVPSTRPASTFAHETGHMFWARDEYANSSSYFAQRGYYNTQNTNAIDGNPNPNFQQATSIMAAGTSLSSAYAQVVSPTSTLAMLGWQDSDGDGIFDVLDVPLSLSGVGRVDVTTGSYRFSGKAKVETLPNLNTSGLGNDITLNRISRIEAKIGSGNWQTIASPDVYEATLDVSIPLAGVQSGTIQIRAIDDETGITSNIFEGEIGALPDATASVGINGFAFNDANANGLFDAVESGLGAQTIRLVDAAGSPITLERLVEPDTLVPGLFSSTAFPGTVITAIGGDTNGNVGAFNDANATTGSRVFRPYSLSRQGFFDTWNLRRRLKVEFTTATSFVSIDAVASSVSGIARLEAYSANGVLLQRVNSVRLLSGQALTLEISRNTADIAYVVAYGNMDAGVKLDNLRYGPKTQTKTDSSGRYSFASLPAGQYNVQIVLSGVTTQVTSSGGATQLVNLQSMQTIEHTDFGVNFQNTAWHNTNRAEDVNDDGQVSAIDVLLIINLLNLNTPSVLTGSSLSSPPYVDVSNDAFLTSLDALLVINFLNRGGVGEGEPLGGSTGSAGSNDSFSFGSGLSGSEGEACLPFALGADSTVVSVFAAASSGLFVGPALPTELLSMPLSGSPAGASEGESFKDDLEDCVVDQLAGAQSTSGISNSVVPSGIQLASSASQADRDLIARLQANPWSLPQPCNCPDCLATDLSSLLASS